MAVVGPTASGKSALALELARRRPDVELVSADSMQVYRGMDIGTAKPSPAEQAEARHHLIDIADPWDDYHLSRFQRDARDALAGIRERGATPVLVGGTGLYLRAIVDDLDLPGRYPAVAAELDVEPTGRLFERLEQLDPVGAARTEPTNRRRVLRALEVTVGAGRPFSSFGPGLETYPDTPFRMVYIDLPRPVLDERIEQRYRHQLDVGFVDEVRRLAADDRGMSRTARQALGYRDLLAHLEDGVDLDEAIDAAVAKTKRFARRQQRWFRRDPRLIVRHSDHNPMELLSELLGDFDTCT